LTYWGEGELYGIPEICLNDKGSEIDCYDIGAKSYPLFNIDSEKLTPLIGERARKFKVGKLKAM